MKIWEVGLKEKNTPANNHVAAPIIDRVQVAATNCGEAEKKAQKVSAFSNLFAASVMLVGDPQETTAM